MTRTKCTYCLTSLEMEKSCFHIFYGNNEIDHPAASQFRGDPIVVVVIVCTGSPYPFLCCHWWNRNDKLRECTWLLMLDLRARGV